MTSFAELRPKSYKLVYDLNQQLSQVQNSVLPPSSLYLSLEELDRQLMVLEKLIINEVPSKREIAKRALLELREEAGGIRRQVERLDRVQSQSLKIERERSELLTNRKHRTANRHGIDAEMQHLAEEQQSLNTAQSLAEQAIFTGEAQLSSLQSQKQQMRGVKRMVLDIGNTLGVSQQVMRMIERRDKTDGYFVAGGMLITLLVLYVTWLR
jgi:chromosome segregation ATPase